MAENPAKILWLNGTFGVGKTATAGRLTALAPELRLFDPEHVGYLLAANLKDLKFDDFQELAPWRTLVPVVANELVNFTGQRLVAVQTVLVEDYWRELRSGLDDFGLSVFHVVLDCDRPTLEARIRADEVESGALDWRLDHIATFADAKPWMTSRADLVVDTGNLTPDQVATTILDAMTGDD